MAITDGYATLDELKGRLDILDSDTDAVLSQVIEAASRAIDGWCGRHFYAETATKTVTAEYAGAVFLPDDLISLTTLVTDDSADRTYGTTWTTDDYDLEPDSGPPYTSILVSPVGSYAFPTGRRGVRITGSWGYAATAPHAIREACLLVASRYYLRKDAPFGVTGSPDVGQLQTISRIDPDVKELVMPYRRFAVEGI